CRRHARLVAGGAAAGGRDLCHAGRDPPDRDRGVPAVLIGREVERDAVDAVAQAGGRWAVVEDVTEMAATGGAKHLGADHAVAAVGPFLDRAGDRLVEAGPAGAALELLAALEQI